MARIVIADASPLIGVSILNGLVWLPKLFNDIWIPSKVEREVLSGKASRGKRDIHAAINRGWLKVWPEPKLLDIPVDLDEGESACIAIALDCGDETLLIIDERAGRAVANELGLKITGTRSDNRNSEAARLNTLCSRCF